MFDTDEELEKFIAPFLIPKGLYCYDGHHKICPFFQIREIEYIYVRYWYCNYLGKGDISNIRDCDFEILLEYYKGDKEKLSKDFPLGLLWDQVKECGINKEYYIKILFKKC